MEKLNQIETKIAAIIEKVGVDRVLHFVVAYAIVTTCLLYGLAFAAAPIGCGGWATIILTAVAFIKEKYIDTEFDMHDLLASFFGCCVSLLLYIPIDAL